MTIIFFFSSFSFYRFFFVCCWFFFAKKVLTHSKYKRKYFHSSALELSAPYVQQQQCSIFLCCIELSGFFFFIKIAAVHIVCFVGVEMMIWFEIMSFFGLFRWISKKKKTKMWQEKSCQCPTQYDNYFNILKPVCFCVPQTQRKYI